MIVVVCLNPALDVTHHVAAVNWAGVNRPAAVHTRPGGKGTNVARNLRSFGVDVLLIGLAYLCRGRRARSGRALQRAAASGNATGAGDAVTAALAPGLVLGRPWDERLRHAAALGAAAVAAPVAGKFSDADYAAGLFSVAVRLLEGRHG